MRHLLASILLLLISASLVTGAACGQTSGYGETDFPNSGAEAAQGPFLRGLLMLHSFEYAGAREAFREAQRMDPDFAMAYWGEAMTHNHPVWMNQSRDAAQQALRKLGATPAERQRKAPTEREKAYLRAVEVLFGEGDKRERDYAYADAMAVLSENHPEDLDAAAFRALSILGTAHEGRDFATYMRAAAIAEEVFAENPRHPGAAHYLIHSYDDPIHAPLGLRPARVYAEIAPGASHALHMPSHIFFALGMWDEGISSNRAAYAAARSQHSAGHVYHPLSWLAYALLQQGRLDEATALVDTMAMHLEAFPSAIGHTYLAMMRGSHLVATDEWTSPRWTAVSSATPDTVGLSRGSRAAERFVAGWHALEKGDKAAARAALADVVALGNPRDEKQDAVDVLRLQLHALIAHREDNEEEALLHAKEAAELEADLVMEYGPPWPVVKPSHELHAELLLEHGRPEESRDVFRRGLERYPRRARTVAGLVRAAHAAGDAAAASEALGELEEVWHEADASVQADLAALRSAVARVNRED